MQVTATIDQLRNMSVLSQLGDAHLRMVAQVVEPCTLDRGAVLFREGDEGTEIFFVRSGTLSVLRARPDGSTHHIAHIGPGELVGELAFLDDQRRTATVQVSAPAQLLVLRRAALAALPGSAGLEKELTAQIARTLSARFRDQVDDIQAAFSRERAAWDQQQAFGEFFVYVLICYALATVINYLLHTRYQDLNLYSDAFTWGYLAALMVPSALLVAWRRIPLARLGLTLQDGWASARDGVLASLGVWAVLAALVVVDRQTGAIGLSASNPEILYKPEYFLHSLGQEVLARGLLQNTLQQFFRDHSGLRAVVVSSGLFALLHIHFGLAAVVVTLASSLAMGAFYLRHKSLLGVTILHWALGVGAFLSGLL